MPRIGHTFADGKIVRRLVLRPASLWRANDRSTFVTAKALGSRPRFMGEITISSRGVIFALWSAWGIDWAAAAIGRHRVARRQRAGS
jgi:hypothetical protein